MARKKTFQTFREAAKTGPYDERPMLPESIDLQMHLSRNDHPQPFYLVCGKDTLLCQIDGKGRVAFKESDVDHHPMVAGDYIYVPAGVPHRLIPDGEAVTVRYKARDAGLEGVAWYCEACGSGLYREVWDTGSEISQEAYLRIVSKFNASSLLRTCDDCATVHPEIGLARYRWSDVAAEIRNEKAKSA